VVPPGFRRAGGCPAQASPTALNGDARKWAQASPKDAPALTRMGWGGGDASGTFFCFYVRKCIYASNCPGGVDVGIRAATTH
jgi:hypothetical protein